jgi:Fe-S oxidoreductase/nitrate reductase gamma subunit
MLPLAHRIAFLIFAIAVGSLGLKGSYGVYRRVRRGRPDIEPRFDRLPSRFWYALSTSLLQSRIFRKRPVVSLFHSFIFYGFVYYLLVNLVDALEGYVDFSIPSTNWLGTAYNFSADILSVLVLVGVLALVVRRFLLPARRDFRFNDSTLLHPRLQHAAISRDSLIVSAFILFHVGSRAIGAGAKAAAEGPDRFQPFASLLAHAFTPASAEAWRIFGYWGALGSVLAFLMYFPYTKHIHIFMAPAKYLVSRRASSGVLPALPVNLDANPDAASNDAAVLGANKLEDLSWPRILDAYACIQCNRCQDVCPAAVTGKSLSPAALEINKRMELNELAHFADGQPSPHPLLAFALSPEAAWACTTCGACMQVCPVQNEQMLDIVDVRRNQVMMEGAFPAQLQSAFRGMERAYNPWGINHDRRMDWAEGLDVRTIDENPNADVLYWVGCAPSYDPQSQKTARALVQLLDRANVNFAVLGKKECCTGDSARRAGNEYLYNQLAERNVETLRAVRPKLIVTTCPHCMNTLGNEYPQLGGNFKVVHHTELLASLMAEGKLEAAPGDMSVTYHDPCYLGRHNGVYDAPRNLLRVLNNDFVELPRNRENSFCCGAGGAQFWKEEEPGPEKVPANRFREVEKQLASRKENKVLAVGCPFCKTMLNATPEKAESGIAIRDVAELLLEGVLRKSGKPATAGSVLPSAPSHNQAQAVAETTHQPLPPPTEQPVPQASSTQAPKPEPGATASVPAVRKKWTAKHSAASAESPPSAPSTSEPKAPQQAHEEPATSASEPVPSAPSTQPSASRKKWAPKTPSSSG